ncbi:MAG: exosome complex protein Rrp42 [Candidatus Woesearchaeota archaeon]|nr:MAG: exosome complex protein Rrp42 [Candidatus Woesearchaeota archaeon]
MLQINKEYINLLLTHDQRVDGRKLEQYRDIKVEYNISENAEGSAKVSIGDTVVLAGVKMDVGTPFTDKPDQGSIVVGAELLPLASEDFELGPPSGDAIELSRVVDRGIRECQAVDFKKLCIKEGEKVWMLFIDIYPLNDAGNLQDAAFLAAIAALKTAVFPKLENDKVVFGEFTKEKITLQRVPIECTLLKIGDKIVLDPTLEEERALDARLTVAVTEENKVCAMQKGGEKGLSMDDIDKMITLAIEKTQELRKNLK